MAEHTWTTIAQGGDAAPVMELFGIAREVVSFSAKFRMSHIDIHTSIGVYRVHNDGKIEKQQPTQDADYDPENTAGDPNRPWGPGDVSGHIPDR